MVTAVKPLVTERRHGNGPSAEQGGVRWEAQVEPPAWFVSVGLLRLQPGACVSTTDVEL